DLANSSLLSDEKLQIIKDHAKLIDILAPQIFKMDNKGVIWGAVDPALIKIAKDNHIKIMPLIINQDFNQASLHAFLNDKKAQLRAIQQIVAICQKYNFYGVQF